MRDSGQASRLLAAALASMLLVGCDNAGESVTETESESVDYAAVLEGSSWELAEIVVLGGFVFQPDEPGDYTLRFRTDNRLDGKSDCNTFTANWQVEESLTISNYNPTRSLCIAGSLNNYYSLYLRDVVSSELDGENLILRTTTEGVRLTLQPAS